jgi:hypothetical protein
MLANPGGTVDPKNVVGRDTDLHGIWRALEQQSLILVAERRMGKTTIIKKMVAEPKSDKLLLQMDVERVGQASEFVEMLADYAIKHLDTKGKARSRIADLWQKIGGTEIAGVVKLPEAAKPQWKDHLVQLLKALIESKPDQRVVLIWDEFPWMLQKIAKNQGGEVVVDLLDTLRGFRQDYDLRMIYTGSIGLHHVIRDLKHDGYANYAPVNDMRLIEVPPLTMAGAEDLAMRLIRGENLEHPQARKAAKALAKRVDGVPYYVHHVVASMANQNQKATPQTVEDIIAQALIDPNDTWQLEHYRSRLKSYYDDHAPLARAVLNLMADHEKLTLQEMGDQLVSRFKGETNLLDGDREGFRDLIKMMLRDHYLRRNQDGSYSFYFDLIRRWWQLEM